MVERPADIAASRQAIRVKWLSIKHHDVNISVYGALISRLNFRLQTVG